MNIAASMEYIFENSILDRAIELHTKTRNFNDDNLCLGGGSFLNSNANMLLKKKSPFKNIHLFPACGDDGAACGAAMYIGHHHLNAPRVRYEPREYMYLGREYTMPENGEPYNPREVAQAIADGKIIAFFQGRSEYGPRALGHRSLLADPRDKTMKETINSRVKHREWFRPFAPVVIEEKASQWFDLDFKSKLMLFIAPVREPEKLPAISHVDNSARLQTVAKDDNPELYELLSEFDKITGVPVLLNTSLNDNNEPLVETPQNALDFLARADIDLLVLGNRVHRKQR
jgi:carbamoyltransferase